MSEEDKGAGGDAGDGATGDELTPEQITELKEKAARADEWKEKAEKLSSKDLNFKRLRNMKDEEKAELMKDATEREKFLVNEFEAISERLDQRDNATIGATKDKVLKGLVGEDAELQKQVEAEYERLGTNVHTPEQVKTQYEEAFTLVKMLRRS